MSFNQILKNNNSLNYEFLKENLSNSRNTYRASRLLNRQSETEERILNIKLLEDDLYASNLKTNVFQQVNVEQFENLRSLMGLLHSKNMSFENTLLKNIKLRVNEIESKKIQLAGKLAAIKQKLSNLTGFSENFNFVLKEDFYNLYNISKELVAKAELTIDLESNCTTLPIEQEDSVEIEKIYISNKSRGIPGNYLSGKNKLIYSIVDKDEDTFFEFFKLGSGPARLCISMNLSRNSIVNKIKISRAFASASSSFVIKDILYNRAGKKSKSIKSLIDSKYQPLEINASDKNNSVTINHLPVEANSISLEIESNEYTITQDGVKIFIIGIKDVEVKSVKYKSEGEFGSSRIITPEGLYTLGCETKIFPPRNKSYIEEISISTDNGSSRDLLDLHNNKSKDILLDGKQNFINYIYFLKRAENISRALQNYSEDEYFIKTESLLKTVNRNISPISYSLPEDVLEETIRVVQSKVLRRDSLKERALRIGVIKNKGLNEIYFPIHLKNLKIGLEEIKIYGNNILLNRESDVNLLDETKYFIDYNNNLLRFSLSEDKSIEIKLLLDPLKPEIMLKGEGYYCKIGEPFEYDKRLIKASIELQGKDIITEIVPKNNTTIFLKNTNVNLIKIEREEQDSWIDLLNYEYDEISAEAGMYELKGNLDYQHRFIYTVSNYKELNFEQFEIWGKGNDINGIFLYPEEVGFEDFSEETAVGANSIKLANENIIKGSFGFNSSPFGDEIYREVDFIDGYTEFLNIKKMERDYVPRIEWSSTGEVIFTSMHEPYLSGSYANSLDLFKRGKSGSLLDENYTLELLNEIESKIIYKITKPIADSSTLPEGFYLKYYYLNEVVENINKYSVDYKRGVIYFSKATTETVEVEYKFGTVEICYDLYLNIENFNYDSSSRTASVHTEEFVDINNSLRVLWHKNEKAFEIEGLEKYYSPILYNLTIGMN